MIGISCCHKMSSIINSIRYENFDHYWMPSCVIDLCRFHCDKSFLPNHSREFTLPSFHIFCIFLKWIKAVIVLTSSFCSKKTSTTTSWIEHRGALDRMGTSSFKQGMFMLSIKCWAVIKIHFYLNECKLAHLLWWACCPDSSISMIDQLSSCWWKWKMGKEFRDMGGWKRNEEKTKAWLTISDYRIVLTCKITVRPPFFKRVII